ncbi:MAG: flavodoxin family protein [Desulfovibrionales bacterium]|nr:MAG: flavodoxin family protein [Desulfovibrionales bacterium]
MNAMIALMQTSTLNSSLQNIVLGVGGSPRKNGNSDVLLSRVLAGVEQENIESSLIHLRDVQFQGCIGCEKCRKDKICTGLYDGMSLMYPQIMSSRGLVLVSPTHNYNITSWMKAFIDRLYCFYDFQDTIPRAWSTRLGNQARKAVIVAICEQQSKRDMGFTLEAMRMPLEALGYQVVGELAVFRVFARGRVAEDREALDRAFILGSDLAGALLVGHSVSTWTAPSNL